MAETMMGKVEAYFKMAERKTTFSQELRGGVATFLVKSSSQGHRMRCIR